MKELIETLSINGYACDSTKLSYILANTMQDAQYSPGAHEHVSVLRKYDAQYGDSTVAEIRAFYAIQQMEECLAKNDPDTALSVLALLSRAYNTLPPTSPLHEKARALWNKAMDTWH
jgi:hypothetical protein